jgi:hypothetical protein
MKMLRGILILFILAFAANWAIEKWVLKDPADANDTGFIPQSPGLGLDDAARALGVAVVCFFGGSAVRRLLGGKKGS